MLGEGRRFRLARNAMPTAGLWPSGKRSVSPPSPEPVDPFRGTPYRSIRRLKARQMTEIYEVMAPAGRCLAKILRPQFVSVPQVVDRLRLEADILSAIEHPNVVRLLGRGTTSEKRPYLVLERLVGHTLRRELVDRGALPVLTGVDLVLQALGGVAAIHQLGVVHRDLKPDNLFLCRSKTEGRLLKILDFGFAKVLTTSTRIAPLIVSTEEHAFVGAPRFVAPEQLVFGGTVDSRADIYTLGLVLYTVVFGREPHHDVDSRIELLRAHLEGRLHQPSPDTAERVSKELVEIIWCATNRSPSERFPSADAFSAALRDFIAGRSTPERKTAARPVMTMERHAEMTAALEANPPDAAQVRRRYGIVSRRQLHAVEQWWREHIESKPKVQAEWRALVDLNKRRPSTRPR